MAQTPQAPPGERAGGIGRLICVVMFVAITSNVESQIVDAKACVARLTNDVGVVNAPIIVRTFMLSRLRGRLFILRLGRGPALLIFNASEMLGGRLSWRPPECGAERVETSDLCTFPCTGDNYLRLVRPACPC
jgi:hypothetical protein